MAGSNVDEWSTDVEENVLEDMVKQFICITNASSDDAMRMIIKNNYNLEVAIFEFFERGEIPKQVSSEEYLNAQSGQSSSTQSFGEVNLLTWNIDGLDMEDLQLRTLAVTEQINSIQPQAVFLQEVVEDSLDAITKRCKGYTVYHHEIAPYFCAIMIRKMPALRFIAQDIINFPNSKMGRYLMRVDVVFEGKAISLFTTHLESTQSSKQERINQLACCLTEINSVSEDAAVILAGDLNARDNEVKQVGVLDNGIKDAWIETGSDVTTKFTWDMNLNDNLKMNGKPRCRFDRVFYKGAGMKNMTAKKFEFVGMQRLSSCDRFASDHWGILCKFSFNN